MRPETLHVGGFIPFSTVDFPGQLCAVVFCQGCPWKCRYCHNPHLQPFMPGAQTWLEVVRFLEQRTGLLDAVVFSGGEPTMQPGLADAMRTVRALGFGVGLHTAGIFPKRLREVLPLVDWIGLDIKAPLDACYDTITQCPGSARGPAESLRLVIASGVEYEIRTTVHPRLLDESALEEIDRMLLTSGARATRRQRFRSEGCIDDELTGINDAGTKTAQDSGP